MDDPSEWVRVRTAPELGGLQSLRALYSTRVFPNHAHPEYVVGAVLRGAKASRFLGRTLTAGSGQMMLLEPYQEHTTRAAGGPWLYAGVYAAPETFHQWTDDGRRPRFRATVIDDARALRLLLALQAGLARRTSALRSQALFAALIARLSEEPDAPPRPISGSRTAVRAARERLDANLAGRCDLEELARISDLPPLTLMRSFRAAVGCTPHAYRVARRLAHAKAALARGTPIAEAAAEAGFCDQGHLTRVFARWLGVTPGAFVKGATKGVAGDAFA